VPAFTRPAMLLIYALACAGAAAQVPGTPERQRELVRMVRQDCGSCHGMHLTGGLGPPLTPAALADKPAASLAATIFHGRPGTPMPPWRTFVTEAEALWIAEQLAGGFPPWPPRTSP
jgi:cytochrome c55X